MTATPFSVRFVQAFARIGNAYAKLENWDAAIAAYESAQMESHRFAVLSCSSFSLSTHSYALCFP